MSDLTAIIFFVTVCLIIAVGVWLLIRTELKTDRGESGANGSESGRTNERRRMQVNDWFNASINLAIGMLLGSVVDSLVQLVTSRLWLSAVAITLLSAGFFVFMLAFDKLFDRLLPIGGVRPAPKPRAKECMPLPRLLSLPAGVVLGVVLARLGLDDTVLLMIS